MGADSTKKSSEAKKAHFQNLRNLIRGEGVLNVNLRKIVAAGKSGDGEGAGPPGPPDATCLKIG